MRQIFIVHPSEKQAIAILKRTKQLWFIAVCVADYHIYQHITSSYGNSRHAKDKDNYKVLVVGSVELKLDKKWDIEHLPSSRLSIVCEDVTINSNWILQPKKPKRIWTLGHKKTHQMQYIYTKLVEAGELVFVMDRDITAYSHNVEIIFVDVPRPVDCPTKWTFINKILDKDYPFGTSILWQVINLLDQKNSLIMEEKLIILAEDYLEYGYKVYPNEMLEYRCQANTTLSKDAIRQYMILIKGGKVLAPGIIDIRYARGCQETEEAALYLGVTVILQNRKLVGKKIDADKVMVPLSLLLG